MEQVWLLSQQRTIMNRKLDKNFIDIITWCIFLANLLKFKCYKCSRSYSSISFSRSWNNKDAFACGGWIVLWKQNSTLKASFLEKYKEQIRPLSSTVRKTYRAINPTKGVHRKKGAKVFSVIFKSGQSKRLTEPYSMCVGWKFYFN